MKLSDVKRMMVEADVRSCARKLKDIVAALLGDDYGVSVIVRSDTDPEDASLFGTLTVKQIQETLSFEVTEEKVGADVPEAGSTRDADVADILNKWLGPVPA